MDATEVTVKVKEIIANIANLDPSDIDDDASYVDDLELDSLSMLEIGVDVDYAFKLGLPDESFQGLRTVRETVALVMANLPQPVAMAS